MWCYICETTTPREQTREHDLAHCAEGQHCTSQDPACATDTGYGRDHWRPFTCCLCKTVVP